MDVTRAIKPTINEKRKTFTTKTKKRKNKNKKWKVMKKIKNKKNVYRKNCCKDFSEEKKRQESIEEITVKNLCSVQDIKSTLKEIIRSGENFVKYWKFHRPKEPHDINDISDVNINDILVSSKYHVGKKEL